MKTPKPMRKPKTPVRRIDDGHAALGIEGRQGFGHGQLPAVLGDDEFDRVADPVTGGDELEIEIAVADVESVRPDDGPGQGIARERRSLRSSASQGMAGRAEEPDETEKAETKDEDRPGERERIEGRSSASHVVPNFRLGRL